MKRIHIIGRKNHGKTTLIVDMVRELSSRNVRVGTIKHTHHNHELDTPGKDSHRHRDAGASVVGICTRGMNAVFWPPSAQDDERSTPEQAPRDYSQFAPQFATCDLVLVEGDSLTDATKIEVWRHELGTEPMAAQDATITTIISDDAAHLNLDVVVLPRSNAQTIADHILAQLHDAR